MPAVVEVLQRAGRPQDAGLDDPVAHRWSVSGSRMSLFLQDAPSRRPARHEVMTENTSDAMSEACTTIARRPSARRPAPTSDAPTPCTDFDLRKLLTTLRRHHRGLRAGRGAARAGSGRPVGLEDHARRGRMERADREEPGGGGGRLEPAAGLGAATVGGAGCPRRVGRDGADRGHAARLGRGPGQRAGRSRCHPGSGAEVVALRQRHRGAGPPVRGLRARGGVAPDAPDFDKALGLAGRNPAWRPT